MKKSSMSLNLQTKLGQYYHTIESCINIWICLADKFYHRALTEEREKKGAAE